MIGTGVGARNRIKGAEPPENAHGMPSMARVHALKESFNSVTWSLVVVSTGENSSRQLMATTVIRFSKMMLHQDQMTGKCEDFKAVPGCGLKARKSCVAVRLG